MQLTEEDIQPQLTRRRPGQSDRQRQEMRRIALPFYQVENGKTLGTPIGLLVNNRDQRPGDYQEMSQVPRPRMQILRISINMAIEPQVSGRSSARETIGRVAAGAIAEKWLREQFGTEIVSWVSTVGDIDAPDLSEENFTRTDVDGNLIRCPDQSVAKQMMNLVVPLRETGRIQWEAFSRVWLGVFRWGWENLYLSDWKQSLRKLCYLFLRRKGLKLDRVLLVRMFGSAHNDPFQMKEAGRLGTSTNHSGGVQGGISNGEPLVFRIAFKPPATIGQAQQTATFDGEPTVLEAKGRHDPCVVPRAVPIVETMTAMTLMDFVFMSILSKYR